MKEENFITSELLPFLLRQLSIAGRYSKRIQREIQARHQVCVELQTRERVRLEVDLIRLGPVALADVAAVLEAVGVVRGHAQRAEAAEGETVGREILRTGARHADEHKRGQ